MATGVNNDEYDVGKDFKLMYWGVIMMLVVQKARKVPDDVVSSTLPREVATILPYPALGGSEAILTLILLSKFI